MTAVQTVPAAEERFVVRTSLSEKIYEDLRRGLMSGLYKPGDRINIRRLGIANNISPTPAREAVLQLVREGALELKPGFQPRVPNLSAEKYMKIREVRAALERLATELATAHLNDETLERLKTLDETFIDAERRRSWHDAMRANQEFHFSIYEASGNEVLVRTIENLWLLTGPVVHKQYLAVEYLPSDNALHGLIIEALGRRASNEAGDLVVQDMREGSAVILDRLRNADSRRSAGRASSSGL